MTNKEAVDRLCRIRDALDFQLRFSEMTRTSTVIIDTKDAYLLQALIETQIKKMESGK